MILVSTTRRLSSSREFVHGFLYTGVDGSSVHSRGSVNWCQAMAGSGGSQGFPAMALLMASSAVMPWAAAESR